MPRDKATLLSTKGFRGRGAERYANQWVEALRVARTMPEDELPPVAARYDGPPPPRAWADRDPVAAARLATARTRLKALADAHDLPVENLLTPDFVRRVMWEPPQGEDSEVPGLVAERLAALGARPWQVELTRDLLSDAILSPEDVPETAVPS
jgi:ribonuclease D